MALTKNTPTIRLATGSLLQSRFPVGNFEGNHRLIHDLQTLDQRIAHFFPGYLGALMFGSRSFGFSPNPEKADRLRAKYLQSLHRPFKYDSPEPDVDLRLVVDRSQFNGAPLANYAPHINTFEELAEVFRSVLHLSNWYKLDESVLTQPIDVSSLEQNISRKIIGETEALSLASLFGYSPSPGLFNARRRVLLAVAKLPIKFRGAFWSDVQNVHDFQVIFPAQLPGGTTDDFVQSFAPFHEEFSRKKSNGSLADFEEFMARRAEKFALPEFRVVAKKHGIMLQA